MPHNSIQGQKTLLKKVEENLDLGQSSSYADCRLAIQDLFGTENPSVGLHHNLNVNRIGRPNPLPNSSCNNLTSILTKSSDQTVSSVFAQTMPCLTGHFFLPASHKDVLSLCTMKNSSECGPLKTGADVFNTSRYDQHAAADSSNSNSPNNVSPRQFMRLVQRCQLHVQAVLEMLR